MPLFKCPHCGKSLSIGESLVGKTAKCPKCAQRFRIPALTEPATPTTSEAEVPLEQPPAESEPGSIESGPSENVIAEKSDDTEREPTQLGFRQSLLLALFDFKFEHYLTPWIIRFTWVCVLVLSSMWLLFLGYRFVSSPASTATPTLESMPGSPDALDGMLADLLSTVARQQSSLSFFSSFPGRLMLFVTSAVAVVLTVLWTRVILETLIVIFNIAKTLRSIEDKIGEE